MAKTEKWGKPTRRADGQIGAKLKVSIRGEGGADGHYSIDSHGMTSDQVVAELERIEMFHVLRSGRMDGFRAIQATPIVIGDATYRVVDLAVRYPPDATHCALYIDVRHIVDDAKLKVTGFPRRILFATPAALPDNETLVSLITDAIPVETEDIAALHEEFTAKVTRKIADKLNRTGGE